MLECMSVQLAPPDAATVVDFDRVTAVPCPCGQARRALAETAAFPGTVHRTQISVDARVHYHRRLIETYYILESSPGAQLQLEDRVIAVEPGMCVRISPGVRHRAIGAMTVLIVCFPKFDPLDEWFD